MKYIPIFITLFFLFSGNALSEKGSSQSEKAESDLRKVLMLMRDGDIDKAITTASHLIKNYPNFKLGKLVYADLLSARAQSKPIISKNFSTDKANKSLVELKSEAKARINFSANYKRNKLVPKSIINIASSNKYVFLVELKKSRLYIMENDDGFPKIIADYYVSIGKEGYSKGISGDNKTPTGVYKITSFLKDEDLPELYGDGAYPINYPNTWDSRNKRTGYGIWIHGVPRDTYSRPPLASEGCIVASNSTLQELKKFITPGNTPIILKKEVIWITKSKWDKNNQEIKKILKKWKESWESLNPYTFISQHSIDFQSKKHNFEKRVSHILRIMSSKSFIDVEIEDINIFFYPDKKEIIYTDFKQNYKSNNFSSSTRKKLFWQYEKDGNWRIIHEDT